MSDHVPCGESGVWEVDVYEPGVDPGGYCDAFRVEADTRAEACAKAVAEAHRQWPKNHGVDVYRARLVQPKEPATTEVERLRALPVAERMALMGMRKAAPFGGEHGLHCAARSGHPCDCTARDRTYWVEDSVA